MKTFYRKLYSFTKRGDHILYN